MVRSQTPKNDIYKKGQKLLKAINRYTVFLTGHKTVHQSTPWLLSTFLRAYWSNRARTAFGRWTQAVHQVAAIQVGRHRFLAYPYRFLAAKRQAKQIFPRAIHTTELPSNPSPLTFRNNQIQIFQTSSNGSQRLSARYEHTRDVLVRRTHTHTTRDKR